MRTRITGKRAQELLNGTTPGPWATSDDAEGPHERYIYDWDSGNMCIAVADDGGGSSCTVSEIRLAAAAPALAKTVTWLYGREPDTHHPDNGTWWDTHEYLISQGEFGITLFDGSGESRTLNTEQAIDLARALLNAAERMNDPT